MTRGEDTSVSSEDTSVSLRHKPSTDSAGFSVTRLVPPSPPTLTCISSTVHSVHKVSAGGEGWGECVTCISTVSLNRATVGWLYVVLEVNTRGVLKCCHGCIVSQYTGRLWTRKGMKQLRPLDYGGSSVITHRPKVGIRQRIEGQRDWRDP